MSEPVIDQDARREILTHVKVCEERYGNLWAAVSDIKAMMTAHNAVTHERFTAISNRMWSVVAGVCGASVLGLAAVVFHLLTRGKS